VGSTVDAHAAHACTHEEHPEDVDAADRVAVEEPAHHRRPDEGRCVDRIEQRDLAAEPERLAEQAEDHEVAGESRQGPGARQEPEHPAAGRALGQGAPSRRPAPAWPTAAKERSCLHHY